MIACGGMYVYFEWVCLKLSERTRVDSAAMSLSVPVVPTPKHNKDESGWLRSCEKFRIILHHFRCCYTVHYKDLLSSVEKSRCLFFSGLSRKLRQYEHDGVKLLFCSIIQLRFYCGAVDTLDF